MGKAVQAVVAVVEIVVGAVLEYYGIPAGQYLIQAGVAQLLGYAVSLLNSPHRAPLIPIGAAYAGTLEPRRIIFGTLRTSGMYTAPPMTRGPNNDYLEVVLTVAGHPVTGFGDVYLNNIRIANADIAGVTGTINDGLVSATITNNGYQNLVWFRRYSGSQTLVDYILNQNFTSWDSNHVGFGLAYWAVSLKFDTNAFATGIPQISGIVQGAAVYDPRLDSTNGGSGPQRFATPSTWTYSTNPALCLAYYLTQPLGLGDTFANVDWTLVAAAANICDEQVNVPAPILPGLTNWQHGSTIVAGIGTAFLRDVNNGNLNQVGGNFFPPGGTTIYILGPDAVWYTLSSVQTDTQLTLTAAFAGTSGIDEVAQWNTAASGTVQQTRFTCNTILDATSRYEDNIQQIVRAMLGQCLFSAGKWRMYAGAWTGPSFTLTEKDLVGGVSLQCATPREHLYNAVRGNFLNPGKNYQPDEFPAVLNASYATADGETIYTETNFPCCTNIFEAQRNAFVVLAVSRDQHVVTAQFGMSAYTVKVWDTGTITIGEVGWNQQTVRCISWKFTPKGTIELQLQEAYSADWADPLVTAYALKGVNSKGAALAYVPYPPTGLTATPIAGGIQFQVTLPAQMPAGATIQLFEYSANSPFSSATLVAQSQSTTFILPKFDVVTRYYWVRTISVQGQVSSTYPAVTGQAGTALSSSAAVWQPWAAMGNAQSSDTGAAKAGGVAGWDSAVYTTNAYSAVHVRAKSNFGNGTAGRFMFGLVSGNGPPTTANYTQLAAAWDADITGAGGVWNIYESGTLIGAHGNVNTNDVAWITCDGTNFRYYLNDPTTPVRTSASPATNFFGMIPFYDVGAGANSIAFGPTLDLELQDTGQLGLNSATALAFVAQTFSGGTAGSGSSTPLLIGTGVSFTPQVNCTVELTISCDIASDGGPDSAVYFYGGIATLSPTTQLLWQGNSNSRGVVTGTAQIAVVAGTTYTAGLYSVNAPATAGIKCYAYSLSVNVIKR